MATGESLSNATTAAGASNAAQLYTEYTDGEVDIKYDVEAAGDIEVEVWSRGKNGWHSHTTFSPAGAAETVQHITTPAPMVRAYASGGLADGDVTVIEVEAQFTI